MNKRNTLRIGLTLTLTLATSAFAQNTFDHDRFASAAPLPPGLLTEGFPGPPIVAIPAPALGLLPGDEIDALSFGDDHDLATSHAIVFSVDPGTVGFGAGTTFEFGFDTAPGFPPAAAGDLFLQDPDPAVVNILAPPGLGYDAGTFTGDEANATWGSPCVAGGCEDLDAFDYTPPTVAGGVYFSLQPGSPALAMIPAMPGDILYSDLSGAPPVIAVLGGGAGPATAANLGIAGMNLDALSLVGTVGPVALGGGVISPGPVGPSIAGTIAPSTHLIEYSVGPFSGVDADVLVRAAAGVAAVHTPAPALGLTPNENVNALEVALPTFCPPLAATVFLYNGTGVNLDMLSSTTAVVGAPWTVTMVPQSTRGPGAWAILVRGAPSAGPIIDLGLLLAIGSSGSSELLVGAGILADFVGPPHAGGGSTASFTTPIPPACSLVGLSWYTQAIVTGDLPGFPGLADPWFSSAAGGVIGTF